MSNTINDPFDGFPEAAAIVEALQNEGVDAIIRRDGVALLRLREMEAERNRLLAERTAAMEAMTNALVMADVDGNVFYHNPASLRLHGYTDADEARLLSWDGSLEQWEIDDLNGNRIPPEEWPMPRVLRGDLFEDLCLHVRRTGRACEFIGSYSGSLVRDKNGNPLFAMLTIRDITRQHKIETELRLSRERLKDTMNAGRVFTFDWDPETDAVVRSDNYAEICGLTGDDVGRRTGNAHFQRIHQQDREGVIERIHRLHPGLSEFETTYRYSRTDGEFIWLQENGRAEFDDAGRMTRVRGVVADVTERVELQRRRESAVAMQSAAKMIDVMEEGVILLSLEGTVNAVNPAVETLTGLAEKEVVGKKLAAVLPAVLSSEHLRKTRIALHQLGNGRIPPMQLITLAGPNGRQVIVSPSASFIRSVDGDPVSAVLILKDVTGLQHANELLNQVFDNTHIQIAYLDPDFNFIRVNRAYADADPNGRDSSFFVGKNHFDVYPSDENRKIFIRVKETGEPHEVHEKPFTYPGQTEAETSYWDWSLRPVRDKTGVMQGLLFCLLNVTERVRAQQDIAASEKKYRELAENANSIIMRITPDHQITYFNEFAQRFFGYSAAEIVGRNVLGTIVPEVDSNGHDLHEMTAAITAAPEHFGSNENENVCKDGRRVWVHWSNRAVRNERGEVKEILCIGTDITRRKELEREAEAYRRRLRESADRLAAAEEQHRRRAAGQIHDTVLQTLSVAKMRLDALRSTADDDLAKNLGQITELLVAGMGECRGLMADLTPPLLYEVGLLPALQRMAEKLTERYDAEIVVRGERSDVQLPESLRGLMFQAAKELAMNAIKHADADAIEISVTDGDELILKVSDDGCGFDPKTADLFHHDETGGFGLFNARERLRGLGGRLEIDSKPGSGTTVTLYVPLPD